ncbi:5082ac3b-f10c-4c5c-89f2-38f7ac1c1739 [Sclerotinia trifoliorum]|uniref:5082ac3b-f10c-4c5c-89f2-38f7ac1c1739 n=1 Tax=Sclerotinia trifoliorum TaxID=28548 RepID=A0A8H2VTG9_9HELO|nr:5082ac3b-f10c-4c5c-89f2-38f7ac1c1739 [Sclerotinia trifoliorum]
MSGVANWIKAQRKGDLMELADSIGLKYIDGIKKTELELALEDYLVENESQLANETRLIPYYNRRSGASPVKKEPSTHDEMDTKRSLRRRTRLASEISEVANQTTDDSEPERSIARSTMALTRTPQASALGFTSNVPLPPSPAVVADVIDRRTAVLRAKANEYYKDLGVVEAVETARETLSNVVALEFIMLLSEALQLQPELLENKYAFTIPPINFLTTTEHAVKIPDLFLLLTTSFWSPFALWLSTSLLLPLFGAYFFNLTSKPSTRSKRYSFDPLTFNIVKGLVTFIVYGQDATFGGLIDLEQVARINSALYGGYQSILVGTGIGILFTMYDAVLKK